jgi:hypothetical protein
MRGREKYRANGMPTWPTASRLQIFWRIYEQSEKKRENRHKKEEKREKISRVTLT